MSKQELESLIDKSVLGTLSTEEKEILDAYIMEHPNTNLEILMRKDIMKGLEYNSDLELKNVLNKIHHKEIFTASRKLSIKRIGLGLIATVLVIGSIVMFKILNKAPNAQSNNNTALYANYFKPYVPSLETRSNEMISEEDYQTFIDAYRAKDYQKSFTTIGPLLSDADNNTLLLAGISAMEINEYQESLKYFDKIIESNDFYFADHAKWYKALLLIKMKKSEDAKLLLADLAQNPKADHHNESVSLLENF